MNDRKDNKVKASIVIHKPIETIFAYVSDVKQITQDRQVKELNKFSFFGLHVTPEVAQIEDIQQTSPDPLGVGTTFVQKNTLHGKHSEIIFQIVEYNPARNITYKFKGSMLPSGEFKVLLTPVADSTKVTEILSVGQGFYKLMLLFFESMMKKQIKANLHQMKERLEQTP